MTIGASCARVCKHRLGVALGATDIQVQALQPETRLIVIEFWDRTKYLPTRYGMTILAGDIQRTVRTGGSSGYTPFLSVRWPGCQNQQEPNDCMDTCPLECTGFAEPHGAASHPQKHPKVQTQWEAGRLGR